ncbi:hypothetical protein ACYPKM_35425 [Pseudomonas aeruginosa]
MTDKPRRTWAETIRELNRRGGIDAVLERFEKRLEEAPGQEALFQVETLDEITNGKTPTKSEKH